jgi:chromosome segregation protein
LKGTRGALSSFLDVPAELETAIAAALGEYLEAVVLDQAIATEDALRLLEGKSSRAVLLPVENLRAPKILHDGVQETFNSQEVYGLASELVSVPTELHPVLDFLLGHVWVVCDRSVARRLLQYLHDNQATADESRVVTLRGEVFHASGPIIAGQEDKPAALSRPRQRKELRQDFEAAQARLKELDEQIRNLDTLRLKFRTQVERLEQEAGQKRKAEELARSAVDQQDLALEKARRQLTWQREQRANLESDQRRGEAEAGQITTELTRLDQEIQQAREALRENNAGLASLSLDELQTQLTHWNTRLTVAERAAGEAEKRRQERHSTLERANQRRLSLLNRLEDGKQNLENLEVGKTRFHQDEAQFAAQIESLQVQVQPAQAELTAAEREQARLEEQESEARQALSMAEHHHAQARINLVHRQEELDSLHRRIEDDFGLVAFEFAADISGQAPLPIEGMVEQLPVVHELSADIEEALKRQRAQLRRMGPINPEAQAEYLEVKQRYQFLTEQVADLQKAESDIQQVIAELDTLMQREFRKTFEAVSQEFKGIFTRLFGGGSARLLLTDPDDLTNTGIDIEARLPGRRTQGLSLLSGGERSLTATALVFALLKVSPTPFCVFDEVDAMLDEANVGRFRDLLRELSATTQFVIVTHNRNTVQAADVIYGVTMGIDSASQVLSLKLDEVSRVVE